MPRVEGLTAKQERFVAEYLVDGNGTRAAIAAGYSERTAKAMAAENLRKPVIRNAVDAAKAPVFEGLKLTVMGTLSDILRVARAAEKKGKFGDAIRGYELIGKFQKLFTEKLEHSGPGGLPLPVPTVTLGLLTDDQLRTLASISLPDAAD